MQPVADHWLNRSLSVASSYTLGMGHRADDVYEAGLELDLDERTVVAHRLLATLHSDEGLDQTEADAAWGREIEVRVEQVLGGAIELADFEHVRERAQLRIAGRAT